MKSIIFFCLLLIIIPIGAREWTFLYYFASDNALYPKALEDINELEEGIQSNMSVIAFVDHPESTDKNGGEILEIRKDSTETIVSSVKKTYGPVDSGNYHTLTEFVNWGLSHYPADKTVLVIWSHGWGWGKDEPEVKAVCPDYTSNTAIEVYKGDLRNAFLGFKSKPYLTVFDACLMGNMETLMEINDRTQYVIASEMEVPTSGFPWNEILFRWNDYPSDEETLNAIPQFYTDSYQPGGSENPYGPYPVNTCLFTADMIHVTELAQKTGMFSHFSLEAISSQEDLTTQFSAIREGCHEFNDLLSDIDIKTFFSKCTSLSTDYTPLKTVINDINALIPLAFPAMSSSNGVSPGAASIWYPDEPQILNDLYKLKYHQLRFDEVHFTHFLNRVVLPDQYRPSSVSDVQSSLDIDLLKIKWQAPVDPGPLSYRIHLSGQDHQEINTDSTFVRFKIKSACDVTITVSDLAGNTSDPVTISFNPILTQGAELRVQPNPVHGLNGKMVLSLSEDSPYCDIRIYDISGNCIGEKRFTRLNRGIHEIQLNEVIKKVAKPQSGVYIIFVHNMRTNIKAKFAIIQ